VTALSRVRFGNYGLDMLVWREARSEHVNRQNGFSWRLMRVAVASLRDHDAVVLATVKDASRRRAAPFGRP
jgi:hypothetical protein